MEVEQIVAEELYRVGGEATVEIFDKRAPTCSLHPGDPVCVHIKAAQAYAREQWILSRPPAVQKRLREYPPGRYLLLTTLHIVHIVGYSEDLDGECNTCTVAIWRHENPDANAWKNPILADQPGYQVFGISFSDLQRIPGEQYW